jgi:hypothetical protein
VLGQAPLIKMEKIIDWKIISKTFQNIANAMAEQWGTVGGFIR